MNCEKTFKCPEEHCSNKYTCNGNLNRHIRSSHPQLYDLMIKSNTVHPRARTTCALSEASSVNTISHASMALPTTEVTVARTFQCFHADCKAELSTYEGWSRHQTEIHGKKHHLCNIDGCTLTFARKEQLRSHVNRFHGVNVSSAHEVWSTEQHAQSYLYGPRRKSLKLLSNSIESNCNTTKQPGAQSQSQQVDFIPLKDSYNLWSQQDLTNDKEHDRFHYQASTDAQNKFIASDIPPLSTQNMTLATLSQVSNMFSNDVIPKIL